MNISQKTIISVLKELGVELGISETDFSVLFPTEKIMYLMKGVLKL